jgi:hypothetical protein
MASILKFYGWNFIFEATRITMVLRLCIQYWYVEQVQQHASDSVSVQLLIPEIPPDLVKQELAIHR